LGELGRLDPGILCVARLNDASGSGQEGGSFVVGRGLELCNTGVGCVDLLDDAGFDGQESGGAVSMKFASVPWLKVPQPWRSVGFLRFTRKVFVVIGSNRRRCL